MATSKKSLESYSTIVARLAESPLTQEQLGVSAATLKRLEQLGMVAMRTFPIDPSSSVGVWFLADDLALLKGEAPAAAPLVGCDELTEADWPPEP